MIYQRHIPREELFSAQLELLMQHGRVATISSNGVGILAVMFLFWPFVQIPYLLLWGAVVLIMLLMRSLYMSNALVERRFQGIGPHTWGLSVNPNKSTLTCLTPPQSPP